MAPVPKDAQLPAMEQAGSPAGTESEPLMRLGDICLSLPHADGTIRILRDINLEVHKGELCAILGPSGCGKTSLLRIMAGLIEPSAGICLRQLALIQARGIAMAMVPQRPTLVPWWTVEENVLMPFRLAGSPIGKNVLERVDALLTSVRLQGFREAMPHELSGGMQMRAALVRAFVTRPRLVLMDEPFSGLDELTRIDMCFELLRLVEEAQTGVVFVTHSIQEAALLADRVVQLSPRPGRIIRDTVSPLLSKRTPALLDTPEFAHFSHDLRQGLSHE